jgi:hypothetical protein
MKYFMKSESLKDDLGACATSVLHYHHIVWYEWKEVTWMPCGSKMDFDNESLDTSRGYNFRSRDWVWAWLRSLEISRRVESIYGP